VLNWCSSVQFIQLYKKYLTAEEEKEEEEGGGGLGIVGTTGKFSGTLRPGLLHKHDILGMEGKQVHSQLTLLYLVISKGNVTTYALHRWSSTVTKYQT